MIDGDSVRDPVNLVPIMGDEQNRAVIFPQGAEQLAFQLPTEIGIQGGEGLVQHQKTGTTNEHPRQSTALLLTAGELGGSMLFQSLQVEFADVFGSQRRFFLLTALFP